MNHGLEPEVDLSGPDNLRDILDELSQRNTPRSVFLCRTYTRIVRLKECNLNALFFEKALGLGKVQWRVIRRCVPVHVSLILQLRKVAHQLVKKVILSVDMVGLLKSTCLLIKFGKIEHDSFAGIIQSKFEAV